MTLAYHESREPDDNADAIRVQKATTPQKAQWRVRIGNAFDVHAQKAGDEGQRQEDEGDDRDQQRALVDLLGAQVGELLVEQGRALAHRLELLGHSGEAVGGLADVEPVVLGQPVEIERGQRQQGVAIGRDEAAIGDRLGADAGDRAAQPELVAVVERALAIVELVAKIGDLRVEPRR